MGCTAFLDLRREHFNFQEEAGLAFVTVVLLLHYAT